MMDITPTRLPEVLEITPRRFGDARGFFSESWNRDTWAAAGIDLEFTQDNHSLSAAPGVLRGLHFQAPPRAQDKLVRVVTGAVLDVAVDIRRGSPRYGQWVAVELSAENGKQLLVPRGFAHGFLTLQPATHFLYKCTDTYAPEAEGAIIWNDPDIGIDWGVDTSDLTLSDKDAIAPAFADFDSPFDYEG
jgi:dTDP-4-dehydrorhamnose 3,5-epimerase